MPQHTDTHPVTSTGRRGAAGKELLRSAHVDTGSGHRGRFLGYDGGGIGLAPLYLLAKGLVGRGSPVRLFAGGRSRDDILCTTEFERLGVECYTATEDGSLGEQGFVTVALERRLRNLLEV